MNFALDFLFRVMLLLGPLLSSNPFSPIPLKMRGSSEKVTPKLIDKLRGGGNGLFHRSSPLIALLFSLYPLHLFAWFLSSSCVQG